VHVVTGGGSSSASTRSRFVYLAAPSITRLQPAAGRSRGGSRVSIIGTNLGHVVAVIFGRHRATGVVAVTPGILRVTVPPGRGRVVVRVVTLGGVSAPTARDRYTYH
jgi:hypothetical protein